MGAAMDDRREIAESQLESILTTLGGGHRLAIEKVARLLLDRAARDDLAEQTSDPRNLVVRPPDVASALDLSPAWVRRSLVHLRHQGLIAWDGADKVTITRLDALIDRARQRASEGPTEDAAGR